MAQQQVLEHEVPTWTNAGQDGREQQPEQFKHTLRIADSARATFWRPTTAAPFAAGASITGAYAFTSSTNFASPAVTLARTLSDTFAGIAPASVAPFVLAQLVGVGSFL
jgi:hypothetical protein